MVAACGPGVACHRSLTGDQILGQPGGSTQGCLLHAARFTVVEID